MLTRLEGFYWVAIFQSYAEAARRFPYPITQPGVYQQVRKLEEELGAALFERVGKGRVVLTSEGHYLFQFCAPFFEALPTIRDHIRFNTFGGRLRIDAVGLALRQLVPAWIATIRKHHKAITVELLEQADSDQERLRLGEVDFIVDYLQDIKPYVATKQVATAYSFLVVNRRHPFCRARQIKPQHFEQTIFVSYPEGSHAQRLQHEALKRLRLTPQATLFASSAELILSFVREGLGFSIIPWLDVQGPRELGIYAKRLRWREATFPIYAAWRRTESDRPHVKMALSYL